MPALAKALEDHDARVRRLATLALWAIGPAAADAVPALAKALKDQNDDVCRSAALALSKIGRAAVPALAEALKDRNADVRQSAANALYGIGPAAADALPALGGPQRSERSCSQVRGFRALGDRPSRR